MNAPAAPPSQTRAMPWRALRHRNFRLYFFGQCVSLLGTWIQQVAMGWLAYRLTGSPLLLGAVAFLTQAPQLVVGPLSGVLIDRADRRKLMLTTQSLMLLQAAVLAVLASFGWIEPWHLPPAALVLGVLNSVDAPLRHALVGQLVEDRADLSNAIALNTLSFNTARFVGPPVAGVLLAATSEATCFAMNALSFLAVIAALLKLSLAPRVAAAGALRGAFGDGLRYVRDTHTVRALLTQVAVTNFLAAPYAALMPALARDQFRGGPDTLGLLLGAAGCGALAAGLQLAVRASVRGLTGVTASASLLSALALAGFAATQEVWLAALLMFITGYAQISLNASANTILQTVVPDHLRGRVMALFPASVLGTAAIGGLIAGSVAEHWGARIALAAMALALFGVALHFRRRLGKLQDHTRNLYEALGVPPKSG
ncbi:MAG: MFS transporter [Rhodocyclaceae bacterium]|nr:MFS transporter [Rhodocyclaceae bacterium]MBX3669888.1 MFS transporter [Rhodocyclaceae bacterium]